MPESRDRLLRPDDVRAMFALRRQSIGSLSIPLDEPETSSGAPFRRGATRGPMGVAVTRGRGGVGRRTPRNRSGSGRNWQRSPAAMGSENWTAGSSRRGRGRGRGRGRSTNSVLPSWYPRTPLHDITAVVRAIERRRASLRETEGQQIDSPIAQDRNAYDPSESTPGAQLEHDLSTISLIPTLGTKPCPLSVGKLPKILLDITKKKAGEQDCLTPQKKLLNSIDTVEKVVMQELIKLKSTPRAKNAEREKRVRTLMSMR